MNVITCTIDYIINAPFFWQSMGITVGLSMFVGSLLYNGDYKLLAKGMITLVSYVFMLLTAITSRVIDRASHGLIVDDAMAWAGSVTIVLISLAYFLGMILGVFITKRARKR